VGNFIWSGKATNARAKVKWETLILPTSQGGLKIIDPKTQSEALLAKLLIRGLEPGGEPWKELLRHKANQVMFLVHGRGLVTQDINWLFVATKLKRPPTSLWKSILSAWMNVRPGLSKLESTNAAKVLRQPIFDNPLITNQDNRPLGFSGRSEGNALVNVGHSRVGDFLDPEAKTWKNLSALGMSFHASNRLKRDLRDLIVSTLKDLLPPGKKPPIYWIFESRFISDLLWDPGDWHWQSTHNMGDAPFFGYSSKRGYQNARKKHRSPSIITFIQDLGLHNSMVAQIVARMWHNARPCKVGTLTWLILNNGLSMGT
jgi:hypothetical protein